jgi:hypothetical protein
MNLNRTVVSPSRQARRFGRQLSANPDGATLMRADAAQELTRRNRPRALEPSVNLAAHPLPCGQSSQR